MLLRPDAVTALDPDTGKEIWSVPYESTNGLVVMTPVVWNDYMFVGGYANKNMLLKLAADGKSAEMVWKDNPEHAFSPINVQPTLDGRQPLRLRPQRPALRREAPRRRPPLGHHASPSSERPANNGTAFIIRQGDRYFLFTENGDLIVADLTPEGYKELSRAHILDPTGDAFGRPVVWCSPAFANQRMYVRNDKECIAVDLAAQLSRPWDKFARRPSRWPIWHLGNIHKKTGSNRFLRVKILELRLAARNLQFTGTR